MSRIVSLVSLGCPKNLVDSETILGMLAQAGYIITEELRESEIIIVNTCSFIEASVSESLRSILEVAQLKEVGMCRLLVVCGCLPQRYKGKLANLLPEVDLFVGPGNFSLLPDLLKNIDERHNISKLYISSPFFIPDSSTPRLLSTFPHTAYVKIADGCSNLCSYCTIPKIRGRFRSRSPESIVHEVKQLAEMGVKEINLVAHDTTAYGLDLSSHVRLNHLLNALSQILGIEWIRLLYAHPNGITKSIIQTIRDAHHVVGYLDLPIQHINPSILKAMNRGYDDYYIRNLIDQLRRAIPDIALRTTVMVGFPGETDKAFEQLINFVNEIQFDNLGVFRYSREEGTKAATLSGQVPEKIKDLRYHTLMTLQARISYKKNLKLIGTTQKVIMDLTGNGRKTLKGRTPYQAPDIDGVVQITKGLATSGEIVEVIITDACRYDLFGEIKGAKKEKSFDNFLRVG